MFKKIYFVITLIASKQKKLTLNITLRKLISSWILIKPFQKQQCIDRILKSGVAARTSPGRPRSQRTKAFIAKVKRILCLNPKRKSGRQLAREKGCSQRTFRYIIGNDLGLKAYKRSGLLH